MKDLYQKINNKNYLVIHLRSSWAKARGYSSFYKIRSLEYVSGNFDTGFSYGPPILLSMAKLKIKTRMGCMFFKLDKIDIEYSLFENFDDAVECLATEKNSRIVRSPFESITKMNNYLYKRRPWVFL